jgi:hypothetical protein
VVDGGLRHDGVTPACGRRGDDAAQGEGYHRRRLDGGGADGEDRSDDGSDLRGNGGSEAVATRAHGGTDGDSPALWIRPLGGAVTVG